MKFFQRIPRDKPAVRIIAVRQTLSSGLSGERARESRSFAERNCPEM